MNPDRITIRGLEVECILGVYDWERKSPRPVRIDLEFPLPGSASAKPSVPAIDYGKVSEEVTNFVRGSSFRLVEELAEAVAQLCLGRFPMEWIRLRLGKPGAIPEARTVILEILRPRQP